MKYNVSWREDRYIIIEAENKELAEKAIKSGEFDEDNVTSSEVDLSTVEAKEIK